MLSPGVIKLKPVCLHLSFLERSEAKLWGLHDLRARHHGTSVVPLLSAPYSYLSDAPRKSATIGFMQTDVRLYFLKYMIVRLVL